MRLRTLLRRRQAGLSASDLYMAIVAQARQPEFYANLGVPDTLDGRFEMIVIHTVMVLRRLRGLGSEAKAIAQALFDQLFADMDRSLRELGAGDLGVGRRVKRMATGFYGRAESYEEGLDGPDGVLEAAIARNVYGTVSSPAEHASGMASYLRREMAALAKQDGSDLISGRLSFGSTPSPQAKH